MSTHLSHDFNPLPNTEVADDPGQQQAQRQVPVHLAEGHGLRHLQHAIAAQEERERKSACQSIKGTCRNDPTACAARRCDVSGLFSTRSAASSWITSKWLPSCATGVHVYIRCGVISDCMWPARNTLPAESRLCLPRAVKEMVSAEECEFVRGGCKRVFFFSHVQNSSSADFTIKKDSFRDLQRWSKAHNGASQGRRRVNNYRTDAFGIGRTHSMTVQSAVSVDFI